MYEDTLSYVLYIYTQAHVRRRTPAIKRKKLKKKTTGGMDAKNLHCLLFPRRITDGNIITKFYLLNGNNPSGRGDEENEVVQ